MARPTKYDAGKHIALVEAHAAAAKTDVQIAASMSISVPTFRAWRTKYPPFLAAYKRGRAEMLDKTEMCAYKKAQGYDYTEVSVTVEEFISCKPMSVKETAYKAAKELRAKGETVFQVKRTTQHKHMAPDMAAIAFTLCNRRKPGHDPDNPADGWQHVSRVEITGADGKPVEVAAIAGKSSKELDALVVAQAEAITKEAVT